jgi:hypothetical protein
MCKRGRSGEYRIVRIKLSIPLQTQDPPDVNRTQDIHFTQFAQGGITGMEPVTSLIYPLKEMSGEGIECGDIFVRFGTSSSLGLRLGLSLGT